MATAAQKVQFVEQLFGNLSQIKRQKSKRALLATAKQVVRRTAKLIGGMEKWRGWLLSEIGELNSKGSVAWARIKIEEDFNNLALEINKSRWERQHRGKWIAIYRGKIVEAFASERDVDRFLHQVESEDKYRGDVLIHSFPRKPRARAKAKRQK